MNSRRQFIITVVPAALALGAAARAVAQPAKIEESDAAAKAISYVHDSSKVDGAKFATHSKDKNCANCQLFQGKAGDAWGACPLVGGKQVNAKGWCTAWVKKA